MDVERQPQWTPALWHSQVRVLVPLTASKELVSRVKVSKVMMMRRRMSEVDYCIFMGFW